MRESESKEAVPVPLPHLPRGQAGQELLCSGGSALSKGSFPTGKNRHANKVTHPFTRRVLSRKPENFSALQSGEHCPEN